MLIQRDVINRKDDSMLENEEMMKVTGGGITSALVNAATRLFASLLDLGKTVGSSIRRISTGKLCKIK